VFFLPRAVSLFRFSVLLLPQLTVTLSHNWTWLGPMWSSPSPWVYLIRHLVPHNPPQVSGAAPRCSVVALFTRDGNCTEVWLGPMWSSPSRYCDTCNLPLICCASSSSLEKSLNRVISCTKDTTGFFVIHLQPSGSFGLRLGKPLFCFCRKKEDVASPSPAGWSRRAWGPMRSSPHASVNTLGGCLICLQLPKV